MRHYGRYTGFDRVLTQNPLTNELKNYLIYANTSPVSYFLNGFNAGLVTVGCRGSCKSRLLFGGDLALDTAANDSILCTLAEEVIRYADEQNASIKGNHPAYTLGLSIADVVYSDTDRTEILLDLLRVKDNNNKTGDLAALTNVQITLASTLRCISLRTYKQFEKALNVARVQSQNWVKKL